MRYLVAAWLASSLVLAGCATSSIPIYESRYQAIAHGAAGFQAAIEQAQDYCSQAALKARHLDTDTSSEDQSLSRFECVSE